MSTSRAHIIQDALNYYDASQSIIKYLMTNAKIELLTRGTDNERGKAAFYSLSTDEELFKTEFEYLAVFYDKVNVWAWAWSQPFLSLGDNYFSREILFWALSLKLDMFYFKNLITTSRRIVSDPLQIDVNLAICASIAKQPYIFPFRTKTPEGNYIVTYIFLTDVEILDEIRDKIEKKILT